MSARLRPPIARLRLATRPEDLQTEYAPDDEPQEAVLSLKHELEQAESEVEDKDEMSLAQPHVVPLVIPAYACPFELHQSLHIPGVRVSQVITDDERTGCG